MYDRKFRFLTSQTKELSMNAVQSKSQAEKQETVQGLQYQVKIYEGAYERAMDAIHGGGQMIKEVFIPSHKVIFNEKNHAWIAEKPRNVGSVKFMGPEVEQPLTEILVPKDLADRVTKAAQLKFEADKAKEALEPDLQKFWKA